MNNNDARANCFNQIEAVLLDGGNTVLKTEKCWVEDRYHSVYSDELSACTSFPAINSSTDETLLRTAYMSFQSATIASSPVSVSRFLFLAIQSLEQLSDRSILDMVLTEWKCANPELSSLFESLLASTTEPSVINRTLISPAKRIVVTSDRSETAEEASRSPAALRVFSAEGIASLFSRRPDLDDVESNDSRKDANNGPADCGQKELPRLEPWDELNFAFGTLSFGRIYAIDSEFERQNRRKSHLNPDLSGTCVEIVVKEHELAAFAKAKGLSSDVIRTVHLRSEEMSGWTDQPVVYEKEVSQDRAAGSAHETDGRDGSRKHSLQLYCRVLQNGINPAFSVPRIPERYKLLIVPSNVGGSLRLVPKGDRGEEAFIAALGTIAGAPDVDRVCVVLCSAEAGHEQAKGQLQGDKSMTEVTHHGGDGDVVHAVPDAIANQQAECNSYFRYLEQQGWIFDTERNLCHPDDPKASVWRDPSTDLLLLSPALIQRLLCPLNSSSS